MFEHLDTVAQVEAHVAEAYANLARGSATRLPLEVARASMLMQHAVEVSGESGLARQELRRVFRPLGKDRFDEALSGLIAAGEVLKTSEQRINVAGRDQAQTVFYARASAPIG